MPLIEEIKGMLGFSPVNFSKRKGNANERYASCGQSPLRITTYCGGCRRHNDETSPGKPQDSGPRVVASRTLEFVVGLGMIEEDLTYLLGCDLVNGRVFFILEVRATKGGIQQEFFLGMPVGRHQ